MSFVITELVKKSISLIEICPTVPAGQAPRGVYIETQHYGNECWYIKNHYSDPELVYGSATISITDNNGDHLSNRDLDHLVFRIKRSSSSQQFIALSFDLKLYSYFSKSGDYMVRDISVNIPTRYHIQCIDLSDNGEHLFYSNWNSIIRSNSKLEPIETWTIPDKLDRQKKAPSAAVRQALSLLDLPKDPNVEEIKVAFRSKLLRVHPDINREDPKASDKTRTVVEAYEVLTRGLKSDVEKESEQLIQIKFAFEGDSITATQTKVGAEKIYIGCYSGRLYLLSRQGKSQLIYNCHAPIRRITESGQYLYVVSDEFWDILSDGVLINRIEGSFRLERIVFDKDCNAVMSNRKSVRLYSLGGIPFAELNFKENIADVFMVNQKLRVVTGKKSYLLQIQPPTDYRQLADKGSLFLPHPK
jgi:hypothetical protein